MKYIIIFLCAAIACDAAYHTYIFYTSPDFDTIVFVNRDKTDSLLAEPDTSLFNYLGLSNNLYQGVQITCTSLTEFEYNAEYISTLPKESMLLSNPTARQNEVQVFYSRITLNLLSLNAQKSPRSESSLYKSIARQLNQLGASAAHTKLDFIFSNLEENTTVFSIYRAHDYGLLKQNPDSIQNLFLHSQALDNLKGITVYFIFKPMSLQDEHRFLLMSQLFQKILTEAGATVIIKADLKTTG